MAAIRDEAAERIDIDFRRALLDFYVAGGSHELGAGYYPQREILRPGRDASHSSIRLHLRSGEAETQGISDPES